MKITPLQTKTSERLTCKPIQILISKGRATLTAEIASYVQRNHNAYA